MGDLKEAALRLAAKGEAVFPLGDDKKPRTIHGFHDASTDSDVIQKWNWNGDGAIGVAVPDHYLVVDIDPRNGGEDTVKALLGVGHKFPATKVVSTKNGGSHRYYAIPPELKGRRFRGTLGPGIDIKAPGKGYVVAPPSPGYELKWDRNPETAPQWLLEEIVAPEVDASQSQGGPPKFFNQFEKGTAYGLAALERECGRLAAAEEGTRNTSLNKAAFSLAQLSAGGEIAEDECLRRLEKVASQLGLEDSEIEATIRSGWQSGLEIPRESTPKEWEQADRGSAGDVEENLASVADVPSHSSVDYDPEADEFYWLNWDIDEPPPPFYLHPIIPKHAYVIVYGATESSKSMVFMALACQASHKGIKSSAYSLENPSHIDRDRIRRLAPNPDNFRITNQPIDFNDARQVNALIERNKAGGNGSWPDGKATDLLIIDTYSHAFNSRSEDGNAKAIEFARRVRYIMSQVGCSVILIDHTGYQMADEPRDASAKRQQVDVALYMQKVGQWAPGQPARFSMANKKSARFGNPLFLRGEIADVRPDDRGLELKWDIKPGEDPPIWCS